MAGDGPVQAPVGLSLLGIGLGSLFPMGTSVTIALAAGDSRSCVERGSGSRIAFVHADDGATSSH